MKIQEQIILNTSMFRDIVENFYSDKTINDVFKDEFNPLYECKESSDIKEMTDNFVIEKIDLDYDYDKIIKELYFQNIYISKKIKSLCKYSDIDYKNIVFLNHEKSDIKKSMTPDVFDFDFNTMIGGFPIRITILFKEKTVDIKTRLDYKI